ncbi:MAG TPA: hypothetical protein VNV44_09185 [Solirubrobacteraceae bacterium]|nr:hypothetical protein [Solirubrobacteraceae bacterium]
MTALVWRGTSGEGRTLAFAAIPPGAVEALPSVTVASVRDRQLSAPVLALSPGGRIAVAWFEERETQQVWSEQLIAVKVRERATDGSWGPVETVWRMPARPRYTPYHLALSVDDAGDAAVLWSMTHEWAANPRPLKLLVATRRAGADFGEPATVDGNASETPPAVAVDPGGNVTAIWAGPWRAESQTLYARYWSAGSAPAAPATPLDATPQTHASGIEPFRDIILQTAPSGSQLAVWLRGTAGNTGRPKLVPLRASWRNAGASFQSAQTVTAPGVEARAPALALSADGQALIGWSEVTAEGGPPVLNRAVAAPGNAFVAPAPLNATLDPVEGLSDASSVAAAWLPGGRQLLAWESAHRELAGEIETGATAIGAVPVRKVHAEALESEERDVFVGGESGPPVLAWIGHSPGDFSVAAVRYVIGAGLPGFATPPAPSATILGNREVTSGGLSVGLSCPMACSAAATGTAYALRGEDRENAAASAYGPLGPLKAAKVSLPAAGSDVLRLKLAHATRVRICRTARRGDAEAVAVAVAVDAAGQEWHLTLGTEPSKVCPG